MKIKVFDQLKDKTFDIEYNPFFETINEKIIKEVVVSEHASKRQGTAHTKVRSEVRGGGRKPWRQKGTGRARHGSIRSPLWRTGGVVFGPRNNVNYQKKVNKKVVHKAFKTAIDFICQNNKLVLLKEISFPVLKTKHFADLLKKLNISSTCLFITKEFDDNLYLITRNIENLQYKTINQVSTFDLLRPKFVLTTEKDFYLLKEKY
ncbi:50S ribosomal protein L4 [symbiont of Argiope bruennichi]|uniref:50S ribosomal protein L4 n=1 Tax=symbiont of Argiope bruennichi TaxID=2810479 RepID=UPI003DA41D1A